MIGKRLVLIGAGHAHLFTLSQLERFTRQGIVVTVISTAPFWYSGMGPGLLSGQYTPADASIDVQTMVTTRGGRFIADQAIGIDTHERCVVTAGGERVAYDVLSLNIGSAVPTLPEQGDSSQSIAVKPVSRFLEMRRRVLAFAANRPMRIAVVGGGPSGCEAAANLHALARRERRPISIRLYARSARLLPRLPPAAGRKMARWCAKNNIEVLCGCDPVGSEKHAVLLDDHSRWPADLVILASGVRPPPLLQSSQLQTDATGALMVDERLQSVSHPGVFGGGDGIHLQSHPMEKVGVYAVRQGPVLCQNLLAAVTGGRLRTFKPQKRFLLILNLGDGTGLMTRGRFVISGRWPLWLKQWLDRRFMSNFQ